MMPEVPMLVLSSNSLTAGPGYSIHTHASNARTGRDKCFHGLTVELGEMTPVDL